MANVYRQNRHAAPLIVWALACEALSILLFVQGGGAGGSPLRMAGGVALQVFGPVAATVYLIRSELLWLTVEPDQGIVIRGRHLVPWDSIVRVEHRKPRFSLPFLDVFSPFAGRVKIVARGRSFTLRDLRGIDSFLAEVRPRVEVFEHTP